MLVVLVIAPRLVETLNHESEVKVGLKSGSQEICEIDALLGPTNIENSRV